MGFERIRRITGYLVGSLSRFNDAKQAEVRDRVKHSIRQESKDRRDEREWCADWPPEPDEGCSEWEETENG